MCCEGPHTCKRCKTARNRLHDPQAAIAAERRKGGDVKAAVRRAFAGRLPGERGLAARPPLFEKRLDPGSKRSRWYPTPACTTEVYEQARKSLGNVHLVENALSRLPFCSDYYRLMFKDTMHGQEHGVVTYMLKATVKEVADLELALGLPRAGPRARPLKRRMFARLLRLCDKASVQHMTLLTLGNQKILDANTKWFSGAKKDKAKEAPLVDAMDAQMLMLAMPFVLEGLAHQELTRFNAGKRPRDQVADPFRPIIGAYNDYLHWYSMYRSRQQTEHQVARMDTKSRDLLTTLQTVFPHFVGTRSVWCTEKAHSVMHSAELYREAGRCKNYSTQALETRHKSSVKAVAHKTNNQASQGGSILKANVELEVAEALAWHVDAKGGPSVAKVCQTCEKVWVRCRISTLWVAFFGRVATV